jgi:hypothetical protein
MKPGRGSWGVEMFLRDYDCSVDSAVGRSNRDTIDGFASIAAGLEGGVDVIEGSSRIGDALAICVGWLMLAAVIFNPSLQLAAIGVCIALASIRMFVKYALGFEKRRPGPALDFCR